MGGFPPGGRGRGRRGPDADAGGGLDGLIDATEEGLAVAGGEGVETAEEVLGGVGHKDDGSFVENGDAGSLSALNVAGGGSGIAQFCFVCCWFCVEYSFWYVVTGFPGRELLNLGRGWRVME